MNRYFVNLPLRAILNEPGRLDEFIERKIAPEIGFDALTLDSVEPRDHEMIAERVKSAGLSIGIHLPFHDLQPGSVDHFVREATAKRLQTALDAARIYEPEHLIAHAAFDFNLYRKVYDIWCDRSVSTWRDVLASWPNHPPLYLENTHEKEPQRVLQLVDQLAQYDDRVGLCFDIGHWFSFAGGVNKNDLDQWIGVLAPRIRHIHLHDNDGSYDLHLGPGKGNIPFDELLANLNHQNIHPTVTFEPHSSADLELSLDFAECQMWSSARCS
ncbi:sugar phosphate isomerase/epimerase family protein [Desulfovibrio inopinatus]|uniref:sugar phosphate isomerase/epimerase family protein n=1 Tax=Desulfovibrio inopinatus TaxID=102109 RepID=UPI0003F84D69|nr:sugar phosphate isomerase/epimerase family protein [Desulfovibrio inopinatus]